MTEGHFIVLEGVDGAGTTTQTSRLAARFRELGRPVHTTREPSDGPIGTLLRQFLSGRLTVPGLQGPKPPGWTTMALLFAADRVDHVDAEIMPNMRDGVTVISDRYDHSSLAYQSCTSNDVDAQAFIRAINQHARRPDLVIVLDIDADDAKARRLARSNAREIYDDDELQSRLSTFYRELDQYFPGDRIVHVDAGQDVDAVAADVFAAVRSLEEGL